MRSLAIELPLPDRTLSPNGYKHWRQVSAAKKKARAEAQAVCKSAMNAARFAFPLGRCELRSVWYFGGKGGYRPRDKGNAISSLKAYIDGCVDAGLLPDDSHKWLDFGPVVFYGLKKDHQGRGGVLLVFTEAGI